MFSSARLKLTAWYLLIIMIISLVFSFAIYYGFGLALERRFNEIEGRLLGRENIPNAQEVQNQKESPRLLLFEDLEAAKRQLLIILVYANGIIFIFSAISGYFLAGKTLRPIENMVMEQNRFITDASHELRTPIASIKISNEVALRDKDLSLDGARELIKENNKDLENLQRLAEDLLSLSKYQEDASSIVFQRANIREIIQDALDKILPLANEKNIKIICNINDYFLYGNETSLKEMAMVFLDNAVKYSNMGGQVNIKAWQENQNIILEIKDNGIGIDKEDIPNIFKRFYRADRSRSKSNVSGTGLGLSLAKRIIDLHKGHIAVSSQPGIGSIFTIKIPVKKS